MLRQWSVARLRAELGALEASAERAGVALACIYSSSDELVAAEIRARRAATWWIPFWMPSWARSRMACWTPGMIDGMRVVIVTTALTAFIALVAVSALTI